MTTVLILASIFVVVTLWGMTPFALFGVRQRLDRIVVAQRRHAEDVAAILRETNALLQAGAHRLFDDAPRTDRTLLVRNGGIRHHA